MKLLAKKMVDEMDEIESCLVIAIFMVVPQNNFGFIALPQECFLFIVFLNPNGLFLPHHVEWPLGMLWTKKASINSIYSFLLNIVANGDIIGVSELRKESCLQWKHYGIKPRCQHPCANICTMALKMSNAILVQHPQHRYCKTFYQKKS